MAFIPCAGTSGCGVFCFRPPDCSIRPERPNAPPTAWLKLSTCAALRRSCHTPKIGRRYGLHFLILGYEGVRLFPRSRYLFTRITASNFSYPSLFLSNAPYLSGIISSVPSCVRETVDVFPYPLTIRALRSSFQLAGTFRIMKDVFCHSYGSCITGLASDF